MQEILQRLRVDSVKTALIDDLDQPLSTTKLGAFVRGMQCNLVLELVDSEYQPLSNLNYDSFDFVLAHDWDTTTVVQLHVDSGITAVDNRIYIPLLNTETPELVALLEGKEEITLGAELAGFAGDDDTPSFLIQFDLKARNRRGTTKPPITPVITYPFAVSGGSIALSSSGFSTGTYLIATFKSNPEAITITVDNIEFVMNGDAVNGMRVYTTDANEIYITKENMESSSSSTDNENSSSSSESDSSADSSESSIESTSSSSEGV